MSDDDAPRTFEDLLKWYARNVYKPGDKKTVSINKAVEAWNDYEPRGTGQLMIHPVADRLVTGFCIPAAEEQ
jgi:hypothetical protein